jgi:DNA-binding NtrC family response regulator
MERARVLVVDDEPLILSCVERILGRAHAVALARTTDEAARLLQQQSFDAIFLDLLMPSAPDGVAFYESLARGVRVKVVCMTGGSLMERVVRFLQRHPDALVIEKPFTSGLLHDVVRKVRARAWAHAATTLPPPPAR